MKKSIKTIAFALLTVGMLAGCKPAPSPVSKNWDEDTQKGMNILFGEVLPYVELNEETMYFEIDYDAGLVEAAIGDDSETNVIEGYGDKLVAAGWTVSSMEGETYYMKDNDAGYQMILSYGYYEATEDYAAGNEIYIMSLLPEFTEWPEDIVHLIFALNDKEHNYFETPALVAANATFAVDTYYEVYYGMFLVPAGAQVAVDGVTDSEINTWVSTTLPAAGWTVAIDEETGVGMATKAVTEIDGIATIGFFVNDDEETGDGLFYVIPLFSVSPIPTETWPSAKIAAAFEKLGVPAFDIPAPESTGHTYEYRFDVANLEYVEEPSYCYDYLYINNMSEDQFDAYLTTLESAGWTVEEGYYGVEATKHIDSAKATASLELEWTSSDTYGEYAEITIYYVMDPDPSPDFPAEEIAAAFATLGLPAFEVPAPEGEGVGFKFKFDDSNFNYLDDPAYCYDNVQVYGLDEDGVDAYFDKLEQEGWEVSYAGSSYTEFTKHFDSCSGTATIRYYKYSSYYGYDYLRIYYIVDPDPSPVWPADDVAEILGSTVTDTLPACTYSGATFKAYDDAYGSGVTVFVGEGNEAAAMAAYADTLTAAGFVPANSANTYASPNNQFTAYLYVGIDGAFNIELALVRHLNTEIAAFLAARNITTTLPDFAPYEADGVDWDYTGVSSSGYYTAWVNGNYVEALASALAALNYTGTEAPYSEDAGYLAYSPDDKITIQFAYDDSYEQTLIRVYPAHVS